MYGLRFAENFNFTNPVEHNFKRVEIWTLNIKIYKAVCVYTLADFPWKMFSRHRSYIIAAKIPLAKHHTTYNNSSRSILIAKSENMARISNDFYELLLLIHWNFGDTFLEEGPVYWDMAEQLSRKIGKSVYTHCFVNFYI
jgi:hypothetical protein